MIPNKHNGYIADGSRLLFKGGKGGGSNSASKLEQERQARINAATNAINGIFADPTREDLYAQQQQAVHDINALEVGRNFENAERQNRFGLARSGLAGGSADIDSNAELQRMLAQQQAEAAAMGVSAAADLRASDERAKASALSQAQAGIDTGTAESLALGGLAANEETAAGQRGAASIDNAFGNFGAAYLADRIVNASKGVNPYALQNQQTNPYSTQTGGFSGTTFGGN